LIAVSDELVRVIFAMLRDERLYNPQVNQQTEARYTQFKKAA